MVFEWGESLDEFDDSLEGCKLSCFDVGVDRYYEQVLTEHQEVAAEKGAGLALQEKLESGNNVDEEQAERCFVHGKDVVFGRVLASFLECVNPEHDLGNESKIRGGPQNLSVLDE